MIDLFGIWNPMALFPIYKVDSGIKEIHFVRLETAIREAFIRKEHLTAISFDLERRPTILRRNIE